jgi:hypothetical protein
MKFSNVLSVLALTSATASALKFEYKRGDDLQAPFGGNAPISESGAVGDSVPGENPLVFCSNPDDDLIIINKVDLTPNPPKPYVPIFDTCRKNPVYRYPLY